ncbi:MAG: hypothetical protein ABIW17_01165 [Marmoricola sp.]
MTQTEEARALDELAGRLRDRFPDASLEAIKSMVAQVHHQYDGSPIRDFIPVLVEREVAEHFRAPAQRSRAS